MNKFKYSLESVSEYVSNLGYTLISTTYINSQFPLEIKCPKGHIIRPCFSEFKRKARCNECSVSKKPSLQEIKEFISTKGFTLLSTEYINNSSKLDIQCSQGHIWPICWNNLQGGNGCPDCYGNRRIVNREMVPVQGITHRYEYDEVKSFYERKGFTLITDFYNNGKQKLDIICNLNHKYTTTFAVSLKGFGCPVCSNNKKHTIETVTEYLKRFDYKLITSVYKNNRSKLDTLCPKGHLYSTSFSDFKSNSTRCVSCSHQTSKAEQEVLSFIQEYFPSAKKVKFHQIVPNCSTIYRNKELDIFVPELNLAVEYCGLFWHSEASGDKQSNQHRNKLNWCRENNIRLITIFEDEWLCRQEQVKNLLCSVMGVHDIKVGARKTEVKTIDKYLAKEFISKHHIQPLHGAIEVAFGLYLNESLVGVMTGAKHHRNGFSNLVLQRLCFTTKTQIMGGASKLFKALTSWAKDNNYNEIVSWSDNRISEGNVYRKLGFDLKKEYTSDYSYVLDGYYDKRHSKQTLKKTPNERLTGKSEYELRKEQGYYRIYDCGKKTWVFKV